MWIVDIKLDGAEEVDDTGVLHVGSVDQILVLATHHNLHIRHS